MAAAQVIVPGAMPSRDGNGRVMPAKLYFYVADSALSSPATLYTTSALSVAHDFPILSDSAGRFPQIWADEDDVFDVVWVNAATDASVDSFSDISPLEDGVLASVALAEDAADRAEAAQAQTEAIVAEISGAPFSATSTTSLTIGTGAKSLTLAQTGKLFTLGQTIVVARTAAPSNQMTGIITAFDSDTGDLTFTSAATAGAGTFTDWSISLSSSGGVLSVAGETGAVTGAALRTAADLYTTSETKAFAIAFAVSL